MTASAAEFRAAASAFLALDVLAMDSAIAGRLLPLVQGVVDGTAEPTTTLQAALGVGRGAPALARPGKSSTAVLELRGVLTPHESLFTLLGMGTSVRAFMRDLRAAAADSDVTTIALDVDSPGGSVQLLPECAALLRDVRAHKPITALVSGYCCSAAYWLSANTTKIIATHSATLGSLGVIGERVSLARRLANDGVDVTLITSTPAKAWGHPATVLSDEERAHLTARVAETERELFADVAQGRRVSLDVVRTHYGQGRTLTATNAKQHGMIDLVTKNIDAALAVEAARPMVQASLDAHRNTLTHMALASARSRFTRTALAGPRAALAAATRRGGAHS